MKKILGLITVAFLMAGFTATSAMADSAKGQKLYLKKLKKSCGISGAQMSAKHSQEEWKTINDSGKLEEEIKTICPNVKDVKDKYLPDLYDFFHNYANDSGNVPSC